MKNLFFLLLLIGMSGYAQDSKLIASCCAGERARCSGTASCSACTNCSGCKHCAKEGGTCGVCSSYTAPAKKKTNNSTNNNDSSSNSRSNSNSFVSSSNAHEKDQYIHVSSETVNVRAGAGSNFEIVAKLKKGTVLQLIEVESDWILVKVPTTEKFGYVYHKYVEK